MMVVPGSVLPWRLLHVMLTCLQACLTCAEHPLECLMIPTGVEYKGLINTTQSGRQCQKWSATTPHHHAACFGEGNYCRNYVWFFCRERKPWCYTTDPDQRIELCSIPLCTDNNPATCFTLSQTGTYTFSPGGRRWSRQPQGKCVHEGFVINVSVPDIIKTSFTVAITGRRLVCSNSHLTVAIKNAKWSHCDSAGVYRICDKTKGIGPENDGQRTCVSRCLCHGDDCKHVTIHILELQEELEICEIDLQ